MYLMFSKHIKLIKNWLLKIALIVLSSYPVFLKNVCYANYKNSSIIMSHIHLLFQKAKSVTANQNISIRINFQ